MKYLAPTLLLLASLPAFSASVADDFVLKPKGLVVVRGQFGASGSDSAGLDRSVFNGAQGDTEQARFSVRHARFGAEATNTTGWTGGIILMAGETTDAGPSATSKTRTASLFLANVSKVIKAEGVDVTVHGGLEKPFNNESSIAISDYLLATDRPLAYIIQKRDVGAGVKALIQDVVRVGVDVQNGSTAQNQDTDSGAPGLFYSGRIEFAPSKALMPAKKMESWWGTPGTHAVIGFDAQVDKDALTTVGTPDVKTSTTTLGPDVLVHVDGLTALAEYRMRTAKKSVSVGASPDDVKGSYFGIQGGYAFVLDNGLAVEPALRFTKVDADKDSDGEGVVAGTNPSGIGSGEYNGAASGTEITVGVNAYWNGHKNKTQLAYTNFKGESPAAGDAVKARVITLQHQISF